MRKKTCKVCRSRFQPTRNFQPVCENESCRLEFAMNAAKKSQAKRLAEAKRKQLAEKREAKKKLDDMRPLSWWWRTARRWGHLWVRMRDEGKGCISCGAPLVKSGQVGGDYDAGHFRSVGSAPHLEMDFERNVHGQCKYCNNHLAGNPVGYERGLRERIGNADVDALKADNAPRQLRIDDYKEIIAKCKQLIKGLNKQRGIQ